MKHENGIHKSLT